MEYVRDAQKKGECLHAVLHGIEGVQIAYDLERFQGLMIAHLGSKIPAEILGSSMK